MAKYLDSNGLTHLIGKIKTTFLTDVNWDSTNKKITKTKNGSTTDVWTPATVASSGSYSDLSNKPTIPSVGNGALTVKVNDISSTGTFTANQSGAGTLSLSVTGEDIPVTSTGNISVSESLSTAYTNINAKVDKETGKGLSTNDYTTTEKSKLAGIAAGAEANQNAFSNVKVGSTTVAADAKTDTLELVAGSNVTLTPDATNDKVTIAATNTTYGTAKTTARGLMEADTEFEDAPTGTYLAGIYVNSSDEMYVCEYTLGADDIPALPASKITSGTFDAAQIPSLAASKITSGTFAAARIPSASTSAKGGVILDISIMDGTTSTNVPTSAAVSTFVNTMLGDVAGALVYKGTLGTGGTVTDLPANHTKGWYYIVKTAGTYAGIVCEPGDMVICHETRTTASNADWDVIQTNIETLTTTEIDTIWAAA